MKKGVFGILFFSSVLLVTMLAFPAYAKDNSIDKEIEKLTHYAEDFETGNIDYVELVVRMSSVRRGIEDVLGAVDSQEGGVVKAGQIEKGLGDPTERTKWVWDNKRNQDVKLDEEVPAWRKIVFDGKKIQIMLNAWPSLIKKDGEDKIFYHLHMEVVFKTPEDNVDIKDTIDEIKDLAERFNDDPSNSNAELLAMESVSAERRFEKFLRGSGGKCEATMDDIFGSENKRDEQQNLVQEITFYEGDNFEAILNLEMCDDCEWHWIGMNMWIEGRGPGFHMPEQDNERFSREQYEHLDVEGFKSETKKILDEMRNFIASGEYGKAMSLTNKLRMVTDAWNEKANNVWEQVDEEFNSRRNDMSEEEERKFNENYGWIKEEQERRQYEKAIKKANYKERKDFYQNLFREYEKKEFYFEQQEWEKFLVQEFKEFGEEICDNNEDDNGNGQVDCEESQCGGKSCGYDIVTVGEGNDSREEERELFCIARTCQPKEEIEDSEAICGNNICEEDEDELCPQDCALCIDYDPIECVGSVLFSGESEEGCPLNPVCIEDDLYCEVDTDCIQPLCADVGCVEGSCQVIELVECREPECDDGDEKIQNCDNGDKIVIDKCIEGIWRETGVECELKKEEKLECAQCGDGCIPEEDLATALCEETSEDFECVAKDGECVVSDEKEDELGCAQCGNSCIPEEDLATALCEETSEDFECIEQDGTCEILNVNEIIPEEPVVGEECSVRSDCGGENDVCSNGNCVTLPETVDEDDEHDGIKEEESSEEKEVSGESSGGEIDNEEPVVEEPVVKEEVVEESPPEPEPEEEVVEDVSEDVEPLVFGGRVVQTFKFITGAVIGTFVPLQDETVSGVVSDSVDSSGGDSPPADSGDVVSGSDEPPMDADVPADPADSGDVVSGSDEPPMDADVPADDHDGSYDENYDDYEDDRDWEREEKERRERECNDMCGNQCEDQLRPCVEDCIWDKCGEELECNVDDIRNSCESNCKEETDINSCVDECSDKCVSGEDFGMEYKDEKENEEHKEEKGVFTVGGSCRAAQGKTDAFIWFGGWGDPFDRIQDIKNEYYTHDPSDWCKEELENLLRQRKEFERGLDQDFAIWFFEKYVANAAGDWEEHMEGIYELYWKDVELSRRIAEMSECIGKEGLPKHELLSFSYETDYGSVEFWEEIKKGKIYGHDGGPEGEEGNKEFELISPYMKIWVFPPKEFIIKEMQQAMIDHEFPGDPEKRNERDREGGLTEEERKVLKNDRGFMKNLRKASEQFGGNINTIVQFKDYETGEIVFNLYVRLNEEEIIYMEPMLPEEVPAKDVTITIDFDKIFNMIDNMERDMKEGHIETPPWDERPKPVQKVKEVVNGIKMWFTMRGIINSAEVTPKSAKKYVKSLAKDIFLGMVKGDDRGDRDEEGEFEGDELGDEKGVWEDKKSITGEVISEW